MIQSFILNFDHHRKVSFLYSFHKRTLLAAQAWIECPFFPMKLNSISFVIILLKWILDHRTHTHKSETGVGVRTITIIQPIEITWKIPIEWVSLNRFKTALYKLDYIPLTILPFSSQTIYIKHWMENGYLSMQFKVFQSSEIGRKQRKSWLCVIYRSRSLHILWYE